MKILTINTRYVGGGGAAYIANMLHHEINKIDEYSSILLYGRGNEGDSKSIRISYPKMDYLSALSYRLFSKELNFTKNIEALIEECDIVHLHNIHGYYIDYIKLFKLLRKYDKKILWTLHDMWPITGRCAYSFGCEKWKEECGECNQKNSYPKTFIDRSKKELLLKKEFIGGINKNNMIVVTPSKWLGNICRESYLNKFNICVIPNGIEHKEISLSKDDIREEYNIDKNRKVILFVAADTNDKRKGISYILDIIPECQEYIFISIGKRIEKIEYNNFIQLGYISNRKEINKIYKMADLFVIPSLDDNFPTTVIEAFANSTPVIGFHQGGIPEQISDGVGNIVNKISAEELKQTIIDLLQNEKRLQQYSINSNSKFIEEYTLDKCVNRYLDIYKVLKNS